MRTLTLIAALLALSACRVEGTCVLECCDNEGRAGCIDIGPYEYETNDECFDELEQLQDEQEPWICEREWFRY